MTLTERFMAMVPRLFQVIIVVDEDGGPVQAMGRWFPNAEEQLETLINEIKDEATQEALQQAGE